MFEVFKVVLLGIIQGITEWLPISSTGHLILFNDMLPLQIYKDTFANKEFVEMFMVVIQFGSILAVVLLYFKKLNPFDRRKNIEEKRDTMSLWYKVILACLPAAVIGLKFDDMIDAKLYNSTVVAVMLIFYGILFIVIESGRRQVVVSDTKELTYKQAFLVGCFQVLALIPGTSRSGATILGGILIGLKRGVAAEFSFFLAIPVMFGASLLKLLKMEVILSSYSIGMLGLGMFVSFIVSIFAIKFLMGYIRKHDFKVFGYYRIILGIIILFYYLIIK
jgi:undecaprenyl-diphosphatase